MNAERISGVLLHVTSLPSFGGVGDFGPRLTVSLTSWPQPSSVYGRYCRSARRVMAARPIRRYRRSRAILCSSVWNSWCAMAGWERTAWKASLADFQDMKAPATLARHSQKRSH